MRSPRFMGKGYSAMKKRRYMRLEDETEVNMTPMLDVVFIMLIFFVVTASFMKESGVDVSRPKAATAEHKELGHIFVGITENDEIWIDKRRIDIAAGSAHIRRLHAENPEAGVVIQADKNARAGLLVRVIDRARAAGVADVAVAAIPADE